MDFPILDFWWAWGYILEGILDIFLYMVYIKIIFFPFIHVTNTFD